MSPDPSSSKFTAPPLDLFSLPAPERELSAPILGSFTVDDVDIFPLAFCDNSIQRYHGRLYEPLPRPPEPSLPPPPTRELEVSRIDGFKSIRALQHQHLTNTPDAITRLVALKKFINALQRKRESYWRKQAVVAGLGVGFSVVTLGGSAAVGGLVGAYQGDRLDTIKIRIRQAIQQINSIRFVYGEEEHWEEAEALARVDSDIFSLAIKRQELRGSL